MNEQTVNAFNKLCETMKKIIAEPTAKERMQLGFDAIEAINELISQVIAQTTPKTEGQKNAN